MGMSTPIDSKWFYARLADRRMSLRGLARELGMEPSSLSRTFRGERRMQMVEAEQIAARLNLPVEEILQHTGIRLTGQSPGDNLAVLAATIETQDGRVLLSDRRPLPRPMHDEVLRYQRVRSTVIKDGGVAIIRGTTGPLAPLDDSILIYQSAGSHRRALCILWYRDSATHNDGRLAYIEAHLRDGSVRVKTWRGETDVLPPPSEISDVLAILP